MFDVSNCSCCAVGPEKEAFVTLSLSMESCIHSGQGDNKPRANHLGGCQNDGPFLGPYYNTTPIIQGTQKGT